MALHGGLRASRCCHCCHPHRRAAPAQRSLGQRLPRRGQRAGGVDDFVAQLLHVVHLVRHVAHRLPGRRLGWRTNVSAAQGHGGARRTLLRMRDAAARRPCLQPAPGPRHQGPPVSLDATRPPVPAPPAGRRCEKHSPALAPSAPEARSACSGRPRRCCRPGWASWLRR